MMKKKENDKTETRSRGRLRRAGVLAAACAAALILGGCQAKWEYHPITDVNNLEGRRVGVNLAWDADYFLTGREDMELVRYDSTADMVLAMKHFKLDAMAGDEMLCKLLLGNSRGFGLVEPALGVVGYTVVGSPAQGGLIEDFNVFLKAYRQTDAFADHLARLASFNGQEYIDPGIPLTGTGESLNVAIVAENFPRAFIDPDDEVPKGFDLEALKLYANDRNYRLNFLYANEANTFEGLLTEIYDLAAGYLSDVYAEEIREAGAFVSDSLDESPIYLVERTEENIGVDLDAIE